MSAAASTYEFLVDGHLDDHWTDVLGRAATVRNEDGTTTLIARVVDQAQLHGILAGLRDIGATLLSLHAARAVAGDRKAAVTPVLHHRLITDRLTLRPATLQDAEPTWAYHRLPSVNEWLIDAPTAVTDYRVRFEDARRLATTVILELHHGVDAVVIGDVLLRRDDARAQPEVRDRAGGRRAELGWVLDPAHSGHGYATEATEALLRYCFTELGVRRVTASCFLDDERSRRLMERLGMRREAHSVRESLHRRGLWLDTVTYALLVDEWTG